MKKVHLPGQIQVGSATYTLIDDPELMNERNLVGLCDFDKKTITFCGAYHKTPRDLWHTLLHEIKHAHQNEYGLVQALNHDIREVDAETTATVLLDIFDIAFKRPARKVHTGQRRNKKNQK